MSEAVPREDLPDRRSTIAGDAEGGSTRRSGARKPAAAPSQATSGAAGPSSATAPATTATVRGTVRKRFDVDDFFGRQPCSSQDLPPSGPLLENLTRCVIEILAGARELDQIARWVSDDVYRHLLKRVVLSARARRTKGQSVTRPVFTIGTVTSFSPPRRRHRGGHRGPRPGTCPRRRHPARGPRPPLARDGHQRPVATRRTTKGASPAGDAPFVVRSTLGPPGRRVTRRPGEGLLAPIGLATLLAVLRSG